MQHDEIASGKPAREQVIEVGLVKGDVRHAKRGRVPAAALDMRGDEVAAVKLRARKRARIDDGRGAETAAELEIGEGAVERPRRDAVQHCHVVEPRRRQLAEELIRIARVGDVAVRGHVR